MKKLLSTIGLLSLGFLIYLPSTGQSQDIGLSGRMYTGYFYNTHSNDNAFYVDRVYLGYKGALSSSVNFQVTSDIASPDSSDTYELMMKYAFINWMQGDNAHLNLGIIPMNAFDVQKRTWGFRYLRKTIMNDNKFAPSADVGVSYDLQLSKKFSLSAAISNGGGYKKAETDQFKRVHLRFLYGPSNLGKAHGMNIGAYSSFEKNTNYTPTVDNNTVAMDTTEQNQYTFAGFTGLHVNEFWVGTEMAYQMFADSDWQHLLYSLYTRMEVGENGLAFVRIDYSDEKVLTTEVIGESGPNATNTLGVTDNHVIEKILIAGVEFAPVKGIKLAPHFVYSLNDDSEDNLELRMGTEFRW